MINLGPHAAFIVSAYATAIGGLLVMALISWRRARTLGKAADALRAQRRGDA